MVGAACGKKLMYIETPTNIISAGNAPWFVLVTGDPEQAKYRLDKENMRDQESGLSPGFNTFAPYVYMESCLSDEESLSDSMTLRAALHRYIFVQGDEQRLCELVHEWNVAYETKVFFLRDRYEDESEHFKNASISAENMQRLINACSTDDTTFDVPLYLNDIKVGDRISLVNTPFETIATGCNSDTEYIVEEIKRKKGGIVQLRVSLQLFGIAFRNLYVSYVDTTDDNRSSDIVRTTQKKLLDIFRRKVNGKETDVSRYEDGKTLRSLFELRTISLPEGAMYRHFLALMLICAQLLEHIEGRRELIGKVETELAEISQLRESKAATDTRAYLQIALYIATAKRQYRDSAKAYLRKYDPKSPYLRQFITTSSKREALKFLGD